MKICSKCSGEFELSEYYKKKDSSDGFHHHCKSCLNEANALWHSSNPERMKKKNREYYLANKAKMREKHIEWKSMNPDYFKSYYHQVKKHKAAKKRRMRDGTNTQNTGSNSGSENSRLQ